MLPVKKLMVKKYITFNYKDNKMILGKSEYDALDTMLSEWEEEEAAKTGVMQDVKEMLNILIKAVKKSDKMGLDEITFSLLFLIHAINKGQQYVQEICDILYDEHRYLFDDKRMPGEGETAMINEDGSFVTLKELGIEE